MSEYSIALSPRNASAAMIRMGISGKTYSRIIITSFIKADVGLHCSDFMRERFLAESIVGRSWKIEYLV